MTKKNQPRLTIDKLWHNNYKYERNVIMPNEVFDILLYEIDEKALKSVHIPYMYGYLFLQTWLWRYAKYDQRVPTQEQLREILGKNSNDRRMNYITGKGGLLDESELTETTRDFSVFVKFEQSYTGEKEKFPTILTVSEMYKKDAKYFYENVNNNTTAKKPLFMYEREEFIEGTLYSVERTHIIDIRVFDFCMKHDDLGLTAFFMWCYIKHKNDIYGGYDASEDRLSKELVMSKKTVQKYRNALRSHNMLNLQHNMAIWKPDVEMLAPTNLTNDFKSFSNDKVEYLKFMSKEQREHAQKYPNAYESNKRELEKNINEIKEGNITINELDLPF